jgi:hypothetical protein
MSTELDGQDLRAMRYHLESLLHFEVKKRLGHSAE